jgi:hypothetical protein
MIKKLTKNELKFIEQMKITHPELVLEVTNDDVIFKDKNGSSMGIKRKKRKIK